MIEVRPELPASIHVVPSIARASSGPSYSVRRLCESLKALGAGAEVAALDWPGSPAPEPNEHLFPAGRGPRRLGSSPAMRKWLLRLAAERPRSILHNHGMWQWNAIYPAIAANRHGSVLVQSPRGTFSPWAMSSGSRVKPVFWRLFQRPACAAAMCFHATAEVEAGDIRALGFTQPIAVIPNGIDLPARERLASDRERHVLFLGRVSQVKGVDRLLHAWSLVQDAHPDWSLTVAGDDCGYYGVSGLLDEMRRLAVSLGLKRVRFVGEVHGEAKDELLRSASLFVLPSSSENFGVAVAEALSWGIPAIVSRGAPWSGLERERAGWWIDPAPDTLADGLRSAMNMDTGTLASMGLCGRSWMEREFSWPLIAEKMVRTYQWLLEGGERPPWVL